MSKRSKYRAYLKSPAWRAKREQAFAAYGKHCNRCGAAGVELHVHHKKYKRNLDSVPVKWLEVLCKRCHEKHHRDAKLRKLQRQKFRRDLHRAKTNHLISLILDFNAT